MKNASSLSICCLAGFCFSAISVVAMAVDEPTTDLRPFFKPPPEFKKDYGDYKSPLKFYNGDPVTTPADWQRRRAEILATWHKIMGAWPPLLDDPKIEYIEKKHRDNFTQHKVRVEIAPHNMTIDGYLLVPDGPGPFPAVIVVFYEPETGIGGGREFRDFAYQLARRNFVALSVGTPLSIWYPSKEKAELQPLSAMAYAAANCHTALANLKNVDGARIGIVGHSYGGKWAMFASCLYDKFACAVWSDPGIVFDEKRPNVNYWEPWYLGYEQDYTRPRGVPNDERPRTGAYKKLFTEGYDLHELHALMAPRPFLVSGGAEDTPKRWQALNHAVAVNRLLVYENRVAMTNRKGHAPMAESNRQLYAFFEQFLKAGNMAKTVFPGKEWDEASPESQGVDSAKLKAAFDYLAENSGSDGIRETVVIRNGYMIWKGADIDKQHGVWSLTKSFTSTILGLLIEDGKATLETRACDILPSMAAVFPNITLRHFTTMTSGYYAVGDEPRGSYGHGPSPTWYKPAKKPLFAPGTHYAYWDSAMNQFGNILTRIAGEPIENLLKRRIADPIGMNRKKWDWGQFDDIDGRVVNGGSGNSNRHMIISARELARFGLLALNRGNWNGRQLIDAKWIDEATAVQVPATLPLHERSGADGRGCYGYNWWVNGVKADGKRKWPDAPLGTYAASGYNNNDMFVIPEWNMVVVRQGLDQSDHAIGDKTYSTFLGKIGEAITKEAGNN